MDTLDSTTPDMSAQGQRPLNQLNQLFITTNPGLETVVKEELGKRLQRAGLPPVETFIKPFGFGGQVLVEGGEPEIMQREALALRSVHHVLRPIYRFELPEENALEHIGQQVEKLDIVEMESASTFRVTSKRSGTHDFGSMDVQRVAGAGLFRHYGTAVDLENFDVNVRVDVFERSCLVGYQLTQKSLSKRFKRRFQPRAALKASVAYALLHFADIADDDERSLLDPFCGSGTILLEAAQVFPGLSLYGCDIDGHVVYGARENAAALDLAERIDIRHGDTRELDEVYSKLRFDLVVTNPPYGVRFGQHLNFARFYMRVLQQIWGILKPGGRVVLIVWKRREFVHALRQTGLFHKRHERNITTGDLYPRIFILDRVDREEEKT